MQGSGCSTHSVVTCSGSGNTDAGHYQQKSKPPAELRRSRFSLIEIPLLELALEILWVISKIVVDSWNSHGILRGSSPNGNRKREPKRKSRQGGQTPSGARRQDEPSMTASALRGQDARGCGSFRKELITSSVTGETLGATRE